MCREAEANKLKSIPLSNNTKRCRIEAIAGDQETMLVECLKTTPAFALQIYVSTEWYDAHMLAFVHYMFPHVVFLKTLFGLPLPEHEMAQGIFTVLHDYIEDKNILWDHVAGFCTDGVPSMAGHRAGLCVSVKIVALSAVWTPCMIHRKQLAAEEVRAEIGEVLQWVISIVSYISPTLCMSVAKLCEDMGPDYDV